MKEAIRKNEISEAALADVSGGIAIQNIMPSEKARVCPDCGGELIQGSGAEGAYSKCVRCGKIVIGLSGRQA